MSKITIITTTFSACVAAAAGAALAAAAQIDQVGQKFSQTSISLTASDHLTFLNQDDVQHNIKVVDSNGGEDDKGLQKPGEKIDVVFGQAGKFMVRCQIHPKMKLAVDVH